LQFSSALEAVVVLAKDIPQEQIGVCTNGVVSPKFCEGPNILTLSEHQCLVWDTASRSKKTTIYGESLGGYGFFPP